MNKKITTRCLSLALALGLFSTTALAAEEPSQPTDTGEAAVQSLEVAEPTPAAEGNKAVTISGNYTLTPETTDENFIVEGNSTITVSGAVTLTGAGDALTITASTALVFEDGASLTLSGYANGFVVSDAVLTSKDMQITATSEMDVFRLKAKAELHLSGENDIQGCGKTGTANRAIVLESTPVDEGQTVTLAANSTLHANNFYRGMETGSAKDYTISGEGMESSVFDFSNNDCGIALSYFDQDANFKDCKLEVSNCTTSGFYMRQDNASIYGLYFNGVDINCINDVTVPTDIAIRFHTGPFEFNNGKITIDGATTTGLWIYDGWNADQGGSKIDQSTISISNVTDPRRMEGKGITLAIGHEWNITDSTITFNNCGYAGINLSNDTQFTWSGLSYTASPRMVGGTLVIKDSTISATEMQENDRSALFVIQVGQYLKLRDNVSVYNDNANQPITACALPTDPVPYWIMGILKVDAYYANLSDELNVADRYTVAGGSIRDFYVDSEGRRNIPINDYGDKLELFTLSEDEFATYAENGILTLTANNGTSYKYSATEAAPDGNYYIWAPAGSFATAK